MSGNREEICPKALCVYALFLEKKRDYTSAEGCYYVLVFVIFIVVGSCCCFAVNFSDLFNFLSTIIITKKKKKKRVLPELPGAKPEIFLCFNSIWKFSDFTRAPTRSNGSFFQIEGMSGVFGGRFFFLPHLPPRAQKP